jgi:hypothetical protein
MPIKSIRGLKSYIKQNSNFSNKIITNIVWALGYNPRHQSTVQDFKELSAILEKCSKYGVDINFKEFIFYSKTISFFIGHRKDIASHFEKIALELKTDIVSYIQSIEIFRNTVKPTALDISKALWNNNSYWTELKELYNIFAWYVLEEISRTWNRYLEENPA